MPDRLTPQQRHLCMSHIRGTFADGRNVDTSPEMVVRRYLHGEGFRYSLQNRKLPGKPDIVLRKYRTVIFVNGCFWHGHVIAGEPCPYFKLPKTNEVFWRHKIELNQARDYRQRVELQLLGWHVITVWECELKPSAREQTLPRLKNQLLSLLPKKPHTIRRYEEYDETMLLVAEEE